MGIADIHMTSISNYTLWKMHEWRYISKYKQLQMCADYQFQGHPWTNKSRHKQMCSYMNSKYMVRIQIKSEIVMTIITYTNV